MSNLRMLLLGASVWWGLSVPAAGAPDVFGDCLAPLVERAIERQDISCFYRTARRTGGWDEATSHLEAFLSEGRIPEDGLLRPWVEFYLGRIELDQGGADEAHFRRAIAGFDRTGEIEGAFYSWMNLFMIGQRRNDFDLAEDSLSSAEERLRAAGRDDLLVEVHIQRARLLRRQGKHLARAEALLLEAREQIFPDGPYPSRRDCLNELAAVRYELGAIEAADRAYQQLLELANAAEDTYTAASTLVNRLALRQELSTRLRDDDLVAEARRALDLAQTAGHQQAEALAAMHLGRLLHGEDGARYLRLCRERAREIDWVGLDAHCLAFLAQKRLDADPQQARQWIEDAIELAATSSEPWDSLRFWSARLDVQWRTSPRDEALADARLLLDAIEVVREQQGSSWGQAGLLTSWADVYDGVIGRLLDAEAPDVNAAFALRERFRSRLLLDALRRAEAVPELAESDPLQQRRRELFSRIGDVQRQLLGASSPDGSVDRTELVKRLETLEREETRLEADLLAAHPRHAVRRSKFVTLEEARAALAPDEAILAFQLGPWSKPFQLFGGGSWAVVITRDGHHLTRLAEPSAIEPVVDVLLDLIERRDPRAIAASARLYDQLLADAIASLPDSVDRLIVLPDGLIHHVPLAMLRPGPDGPPLAERFALTLAPSATLWHGWRQRDEEPATRPALVLADPDLPRSVVAEPETKGERLTGWIAGAVPAALPFARYEGALIRRHLGRGARLLVGQSASEDALKRTPLADFAVLHLAAHAVIDVRRPQRSAVLLAPGDGGDDGLLQPREIVELDLPGRLVVLAACQGASGRLLRGEGVMSLARAFFEAGSRAVVGSLWPLRDDEAALFFDHFYAALDRGLSVSDAMGAAQRRLAEDGYPPAAWAGLVIIGDGFYTPLPASRSRSGAWSTGGFLFGLLWVLVGVLLCVFLSGLYVLAVWRRRRT